MSDVQMFIMDEDHEGIWADIDESLFDFSSHDERIICQVVDECIEVVHKYFQELLENNPQWEMDSIDDFALIPNKEICAKLEQLKERNE